MDDLNQELPSSPSPQIQDENFTPWKAGDPYTFSLDEEVQRAHAARTENPWKSVQDYFSTREGVRCDAWKDEVQHLLIFSGLFSAVVTAFLVESYKSLQQDPSEVSVLLLARISTQLNSITSAGQISPMPSLSPPSLASSKRINTFWFLSLVCSLTSALVGIVAMQWIREHLRPPPQGLSRRKAAPLIHMNIEALDRFRVPEIFTALPLLLLFGLVFFFIGLVDFLWNLDQTVAIPSLVAIVLTMLFLFISTLLPGFLALSLYTKPRPSGSPSRVPCAYKSPQAWAFLRLLLGLKRLLKYATTKAQRGFSKPFFLPPDSLKIVSSEKGMKTDWFAHDLLWLRQRDIDKMVDEGDTQGLINTFRTTNHRISSIHDSMYALLKMKENLPSGRKDEFAAIYKCFHELTTFTYGREMKFQRELLQHVIYNLLLPAEEDRMAQFLIPLEKAEPQAYASSNLPKRSFRNQIPVLLDVARLLFATYAAPNDRVLARTLALQHVEICLRLTSHVFSGLPRKLPEVGGVTLIPPLVLVDGYFAENEVAADSRISISGQVLHIVAQFFTLAIHAPQRITPHNNSTHTSQYAGEFLSAAGRILSFNMKDESIRLQHDAMVSSLAHHLQTAGRVDYLFMTASIYAEGFCRRPHSNRSSQLHGHKMARINHLLTALQTYKPGFHQRHDDEDTHRIKSFFSLQRGFWGFLSKSRYGEKDGSVGLFGTDTSGSGYASRSSTWPSDLHLTNQSDAGIFSPADTMIEDAVDEDGGGVIDSAHGIGEKGYLVASPGCEQLVHRRNDVDSQNEKADNAYIEIITRP